jgi:hypothetical protein
MNKNRKTSHILNVFQYDETTGAVTLPSTLVLTAPASNDNSTKVGTTAWVRTYVTGLSYLTGNQSITVSGDATGSGTTSIALTLANTAVTPGVYGSATLVPVVTVDSKGRITSVTTVAISGSLTFTGDVTGTGTTGTSTGLTLAASGVTAGTYTKVTVDTKGRVTVGASATTSDISEGTNLYYTDARVGTYLTTNNYATQSYVGTQVANLVAAAPATLDTLNELAAALGNDPSFATTVSTSIGTKVPQTRTLTINGTGYDLSADRSWTINSMVYPSAGIALSTGTAWGTSITDNSSNWNTAYGWGNHASGGYLTSATAATTYASLTGAYANPAFVASLAYSKITGVPAFLTSYTETDPYRVTTVAVSGTSTKTITLTRADASTVTTTWTDIDTDTNTYVTSAGFSGGNLTLTRNDTGQITVSLDGRYYLATNPSSYIALTSLSFVAGSGGYNSTTGVITIPTNNNQLTNGAGYITGTIPTNNNQLTNGAGYITSSGSISGNAATATTFSTGRTNYKGVTDNAVAGQLMWKNYANNHTIFDASASTSPDGGAVNNTNPSNNWSASYPTLMGWNGSGTYGVRVDSARISDSTSGNAATATYATTAGSAPNAGNYNTSYGVTAGEGNGLKFWNGSDTYKISMGNAAEYHYGPVTDYSIKTAIDSVGATRGFTWGVNGGTPVAGLNVGNGNMQIAGTFTASNISGTNTGDQTNISGNAATVSNLTAVQFFNNMGNSHGTYQDFNSVGNFGVRYMQGSTNGPQGGQHYGFTLGLGNDYAYGTYGSQFYWLRNTTNPYIYIRYQEGGSWGAWTKAAAGYADSAGSAPANGGTSSNTNSVSSATGGGYTWTGINYFETNNGGSSVNNSNSAKLQAYSSGNNTAFMSFHRGGYYATNFGLDNDNVFRLGGWSAAANRWQLDMSGNMTVAGDVTAYSDARVKENIATIENALSKVLALRGVSYNRIDSDDKKTKIGVIAQETLPIVPEVVNQDNDGMYNVSYGNLAGLFIEAFKEQQKEIEELKTLIYGITR